MACIFVGVHRVPADQGGINYPWVAGVPVEEDLSRQRPFQDEGFWQGFLEPPLHRQGLRKIRRTLSVRPVSRPGLAWHRLPRDWLGLARRFAAPLLVRGQLSQLCSYLLSFSLEHESVHLMMIIMMKGWFVGGSESARDEWKIGRIRRAHRHVRLSCASNMHKAELNMHSDRFL